MNKYTYIDYNSDKIIFVCEAKDILEADLLFEKEKGKNPAKMPTVGCTVLKVDNK